MRKAAWRLLPLLSLGLMINFLDRTNVGFAALTMNSALRLTATMFGFGASLLFVGYVLFEVPSNFALYHFGARRWLARIMITWGLASAASAIAQGEISFYITRFLTGAAEAGFFPGVAFYLSIWFPSRYRTRVLAWFTVAIPVSSLVGAPLSGVLLGMNGIAGIAGWQWLFIVEGLPAVIAGVIMLGWLQDRPQEAHWLTTPERDALLAALANEHYEAPKRSFLTAVKDPRVLLASLIIFGFTTGNVGIGIWLPQILKTHGLSNSQVGLLTAVPYFFATTIMFVWARQVDRSGKRVSNLSAACLTAGAGFALSVLFHSLIPAVITVTIALIGINSARVVFWTIPPRFLIGTGAAGGFAFINSIGNMGGVAGPWMVGWLKDLTGSFKFGLLGLACTMIVVGVFALLFHTRWLQGPKVTARTGLAPQNAK
jgi:MFS family permease